MTERKQDYVDESIKQYKYVYEGPVLCYGRVIANKFKANTVAVSQKKAVVNIKDQYKRWNGLGRKHQIDIDDNLVINVGEYN